MRTLKLKADGVLEMVVRFLCSPEQGIVTCQSFVSLIALPTRIQGVLPERGRIAPDADLSIRQQRKRQDADNGRQSRCQ